VVPVAPRTGGAGGPQNSPPRTPLCRGRGTHLPAQGGPHLGRLWIQRLWHPSVIHRKVRDASYTHRVGEQQIRPDADRPSPSAHFVHVADCRKIRCSTQFGFTVIGMSARIEPCPDVPAATEACTMGRMDKEAGNSWTLDELRGELSATAA
jgi:hypothetical protein